MAIILPLDLEEILVGKLSGGEGVGATIFVILVIITIMALSMKFRIPSMIAMGILFMGMIFLAGTTVLGEHKLVMGIVLVLAIIIVMALANGFKKLGGS